MIAGLVLAAGEGRRFGGQKLLAELDGRPLLEHVLDAMAAAPLDRVVCMLGADAEQIRRKVDLHGAEAVVCEGWSEGLAASLRTGIETLADADAVVVALGDQPLIEPAAIERVIGARGEPALAVRASYNGIAAHPTLLERRIFTRLLELTGDVGASAILTDSEAREVPCDDLGPAADVDTPNDLAALRDAREQQRR